MTVLGELICRPALDPSEIDREREVIIEEIRGYLDDPAEYAQILFQQAMFGSSALGREICGEESDVRALPADGIRTFWASTYRPGERGVAVAGDLEHDEAVDLADSALRAGQRRVHGFEPAPGPAGRRRGSSPASATRPRRSCAWASRRCRATTPTRGPSRS